MLTLLSRQNNAQSFGRRESNAETFRTLAAAGTSTSITREIDQQAPTTVHKQLLHADSCFLSLSFHSITKMSFDQLSSLESQPTTTRRQDDPQYSDDPEFQRLSQDLMAKLFTLTGNISRLSNEIALLGTKRDTERVRERVHDLLEETKETFKEVGEGVKTIQSWEDVSVSSGICYAWHDFC